ncbi:MAG: Xaa-Pro peptidase family protein [Thermodesulfobacteriota bacterium]
MLETVPLRELENRWNRCRVLLKNCVPEAAGIIVFSRLNIYYLSGTFGNGIFWLPLEDQPVLLCRRGLDRARIESALEKILPFRSYRDIEAALRDAGSALPKTVAAEMNGLSWALGGSLTAALAGHALLAGDKVLAMARGTKSDWELAKLERAGAAHARCLAELLPPLLGEGMSELAIAHLLSRLFYEEGHHGILRMGSYGEEVFMGHIAAGDSGNYPSVFNGPLGLRGAHPAVPHMGSAARVWRAGEPLTIDNGFCLEGYQTDKTQVYWLGERRTIPAGVRAAQDFCLEVQSWIVEHLRPGVLPSDIWQHVSAWAEQAGWGEGFMGLGRNKVGFVGHGIGLAIDEYPVLARGFDLPLEEGMVLAVEPKIGIPQAGMVGVENTFAVTEQGGRSLTGGQGDIICIAG